MTEQWPSPISPPMIKLEFEWFWVCRAFNSGKLTSAHRIERLHHGKYRVSHWNCNDGDKSGGIDIPGGLYLGGAEKDFDSLDEAAGWCQMAAARYAERKQTAKQAGAK